MKKKHLKQDPQAHLEATKYENPIPSRDYLLSLLRDSIGPLTRDELAQELGIRDEEQREALRRRLTAMERDGQVVRNRRGAYGGLDKMNLIKGRVTGHPEGFGFVVTGASEEDIYLSSRQMRRVFDGDEVLVRIAGRDHRGRPEGSIVEVVEHRTEKLVGRYFVESGIHFVRPDNPRISQDIPVPPDGTAAAKPGQIVAVAITSQPSRQNPPAGRIIQVLGEHHAPGMEIEIAIHNYGIPNSWPKAVEEEAASIADTVLEKDKKHRVNLCDLPLVTIDGEDARDFDDAVYAEPTRSGWRLLVAIADVSHYVKPDTPLDQEAWSRGNSVYFPGQVVPMLPEKLSNGLCSLNPKTDRLCMVCDMRINKQGQVTRFQFYEGLMHSRARLTYTQVAAIIEQKSDKHSGVRKQFHSLLGHLDNLHSLYQLLRQAREQRGAIDFETGETRILFDDQRKIQQIIPTERTEAHKLIEECMLSANVCAARLLEKNRLPALYRVHEGPVDEKLDNLRDFLGELGLGLSGGDDPTPLDFQNLLSRVAGRPDAHVIQAVMLRSMTRAIYQPENDGHFGLNYDAYTHFTSPIRRYPDLLVHRAIRSLIRSNKKVANVLAVSGVPSLSRRQAYPYDNAWMVQAGDHCSMTERRADEATRDVVNWLKCDYLLEKVGDEFDGVVTAVTGFGLFVELDELLVEGLVHITGLPKDYYHHEPAHHRLVGERTRRVFRLGDSLRVRVSRVDLEERKIDFDLVETGRQKKLKKPLVSPRAKKLAEEYENQRKKRRKGKTTSASKPPKGKAGRKKAK